MQPTRTNNSAFCWVRKIAMAYTGTDKQAYTLLQVEKLQVHFPTDRGMLKAVNGVSFQVSRGKTLGIVGESGCGKSITGKAILGLQPKTTAISGEIKLGDVDLVKLKRNGAEIRAIRGSRIAMIFQEPMA